MSDIGTQVEHERHPRFWLPPARPFAFAALAAGNGVQVVAGGGIVVGWALEETTGAAVARAVIGDGDNVAQQRVIAPVRLAANESVRDLVPGKGLAFLDGLSVLVTAGTVAGSLWLIMLDRDELDRIIATRTGQHRPGR